MKHKKQVWNSWTCGFIVVPNFFFADAEEKEGRINKKERMEDYWVFKERVA